MREKLESVLSLDTKTLEDPMFGHIFKNLTSEYLVASDDGTFVNLVCFSWLDLSQEVEAAGTEVPVWQTDLSHIKSIETNDIVPLHPVNEQLAAQLLQPLMGHCLGHSVDVWRYSVCVGLFARQEMITKADEKGEAYSLGMSSRLVNDPASAKLIVA